MNKATLEKVEKLIETNQYHEARVILKTIDDPTAREWEAELDKLDPPYVPNKSKTLPSFNMPPIAMKNPFGCEVYLFLLLVIIIVYIVGNPPASRAEYSTLTANEIATMINVPKVDSAAMDQTATVVILTRSAPMIPVGPPGH